MGKDWPMIQEAVDARSRWQRRRVRRMGRQLKVVSGGQFAEIYRP